MAAYFASRERRGPSPAAGRDERKTPKDAAP